MADFDDISDICEYHAPEKVAPITIRKSKKSRKRKKVRVDDDQDYTTELRPKQFLWVREDVFNQTWKIIEDNLMQLTSMLFRKYVNQLYTFIERYSTESKVVLKDGTDIGFNYGLIPTAMIALNSNMTQVRIADEIKDLINQKSTNIKMIHLNRFNSDNLGNICKEFSAVLLDEKFCQQCDIDESKVGNLIFDEMFNLWFDNVCKIKSKKPFSSAIVIFIYDFENFNKQLLTTLVQILKEYVRKIPIIFVFMIYNQLNSTIQHFLPALATDCLMIEDIPSYYEPKLSNFLLCQFIADPSIQFKIHPKLIAEISQYLKYEFSFSNLLILLKSLLFDHCYSNPLSVILDQPTYLEKLRSDSKLLETFENSISLPRENYIANLYEQYQSLLSRHSEFVFNLEVLIELHRLCHNSCKDFISLYCEMIDSTDYDFTANFLSPFTTVSQNQWNSSLGCLVEKYRKQTQSGLLSVILDYERKLCEIIEKEVADSDKQQECAKKLGLDCEVKIIKDKLRNLHSRAEWRASIIPKKPKSELTLFELWRVELLGKIETTLKSSSPSCFKQLIEALFYNSPDFIHQHYFVSIRECLDFSLKYPGKQFTRKHGSSVAFKSIYPNSYILYQLYKDAPTIVNLDDWYRQFCEEKNLSRSSSSRKLSKEELLVNFLSVISDFEYIGLIQASRYKADYFNKITWI